MAISCEVARHFDLVITKWGARYRGRRFPCAVGRSGIGDKQREGDGVTPRGRFRILHGLFRGDRVDGDRLAPPKSRIADGLIWSDDAEDPAYNRALVAFDHPFSHEQMRRADPMYDLVAVLDFNLPDVRPGLGSAIFLHVWRKPRHPTEGCVAMARHDVKFVLENWDPRARVIIR